MTNQETDMKTIGQVMAGMFRTSVLAARKGCKSWQEEHPDGGDVARMDQEVEEYVRAAVFLVNGICLEMPVGVDARVCAVLHPTPNAVEGNIELELVSRGDVVDVELKLDDSAVISFTITRSEKRGEHVLEVNLDGTKVETKADMQWLIDTLLPYADQIAFGRATFNSLFQWDLFDRSMVSVELPKDEDDEEDDDEDAAGPILEEDEGTGEAWADLDVVEDEKGLELAEKIRRGREEAEMKERQLRLVDGTEDQAA